MSGFKLITTTKEEIHFEFYLETAPITCKI
jgi:hypothetical protein